MMNECIEDDALIMYWSGLSSNDGIRGDFMLSPVLQWGSFSDIGGGQFWTLAVWSVRLYDGLAGTGTQLFDLPVGTPINKYERFIDGCHHIAR